jgi:hypothetical protein
MLAAKDPPLNWRKPVPLPMVPVKKYSSLPRQRRKVPALIDALFKTTGQRYFHVPCPHCGALQKLVFETIEMAKR